MAPAPRRCLSLLYSPLSSVHTLQTTFNELNIQVGKDYVYAHEGDVYNCLVFTDIRRIHPDEVFPLSHIYMLQDSA